MVPKSFEMMCVKTQVVPEDLSSLLEPYGEFIHWFLENRESEDFQSQMEAKDWKGYDGRMRVGLAHLFEGSRNQAYEGFSNARELIDRQYRQRDYDSLTALIDNIDIAIKIAQETQKRFKVAKAFVTGASN